MALGSLEAQAPAIAAGGGESPLRPGKRLPGMGASLRGVDHCPTFRPMWKKRTRAPGQVSSCRASVRMTELDELARALARWPLKSAITLDQIAEPSQAFWVAWCLEELDERRPNQPATLWVLCRDVTQQDRLANEIPVWTQHPILYFPQHDAVHFEGALPDPETASERLQTLHALGRPAEAWRAVLLHHESLEESVVAPGSLDREELQVEVGSRWDPEVIARNLQEAEFERVPQVFERGQYAQRGGITDVFPWQAKDPLRIEFFDREIESIRVFDIDAQTSVRPLERASLLLKHSSQSFGSLREYLREGDRRLAIECGEEVVVEAELRMTEFSTEATTSSPAWASMDGPLGEFHAGDFVLQETRRQRFVQQLEQWTADQWQIRMYFNNKGEVERFRELVPAKALERAGVQFCEGRLAKGFTIPAAKLAILTDAEIFGRYQHGRTQRLFQRISRQRRVSSHSDFTQLQADDFVVHAEYGIGRYLEIQRRERHGREEEVLVIEYAEEAKLYVPLEQAHLVSRYVGVGQSMPRLNKLGSSRWMKVRKAAERAIMDYAGELLKFQASRQTYKGTCHSGDTSWQWEFENAFLYKETRDQIKAIHETKTDMESELPMDRLICGDVGFGKTEVAIRASFKAVMSGYQVGVLVPTTILARQHFQTFCERMSDYPIRIEHLSRFRSPAEQGAVIRDLANGSVDIVIGTHRLISKDVAFKKLGLVIIDEEQRFGVRHKEKFKERFHLVDVLTLSATPIPRTLYMALVGVRDMSTIETAPPNRLPVHTTICAYDERLVRDVIHRELKRDGQVYYLHNRIESIEGVARSIRELCPGARVGVGHGKMDKVLLENVMHRFVDGRIDVLVCTTIIESGIDIPNANTIIIDRADRFGLADLYQLRGRVGRSQRKAYAILLLPRYMLSGGDARKRMRAIRDHSSLGSGFKIAMRDLEIRGAGNLLGTQQSGHIVAVGFELYCQLLKQSIAALQGRHTVTRVDVPLRVDFLTNSDSQEDNCENRVPAYLPASYIEEAPMRIAAYRQLAQLTTMRELKRLRQEWRDRFGPPPPAVECLLACTELRMAAAHAGVSVVEIKEGKLMLTKGGDYLLVNGKFPRPGGATNRERLFAAVEMVHSLNHRNIRPASRMPSPRGEADPFHRALSQPTQKSR